MIGAITALANEVWHELVAEPGPLIFAVEVIQFLILVAGIWLLAKRMLVPMLEKRRAQVIEQLQEARGADERIDEARTEARRISAEARQQADERVREAKDKSAQAHREAMAVADEEAAGIIQKARQTLEQEETDAVSTVHTQLVDLVTIATRGVLEEALSEDERRELVEKSVLGSLEQLEDVAILE